MMTMKQIIADTVDDEVKKYRALRNSTFNVSWEKGYIIHQKKRATWEKIEFLKKLKKACIDKK